MKDVEQAVTAAKPQAGTKRLWQTPILEVLPVAATQNNGLVAPGDDIFSPSPTGS